MYLSSFLVAEKFQVWQLAHQLKRNHLQCSKYLIFRHLGSTNQTTQILPNQNVTVEKLLKSKDMY